MRFWQPHEFKELCPALLDFLHSIHFETRLKIYLGYFLDEPSFHSDEFGFVAANWTWTFTSLDFENITHTFAEEMMKDIMRYESDEKITKYGVFLYKAEGNKLHYGKAVG